MREFPTLLSRAPRGVTLDRGAQLFGGILLLSARELRRLFWTFSDAWASPHFLIVICYVSLRG